VKYLNYVIVWLVDIKDDDLLGRGFSVISRKRRKLSMYLL